jgi:acyl-CoA synthetase (NDP forming)
MDQHEAVDIALALSWAPLPAGRRAVIVTYSGGAGAWTADAVEAEDLEVPVLGADLQQRIARLIPAYGSPANPVDVTAQVINTAGGVVPVLALLLASPEVDLVILVMNLASPDSIKREGKGLLEMLAASPKPILVHSYTQPAPESVELLAGLRLPWFPTTRRTARAARALVEYAAFRRRLGAAQEATVPAAPPEVMRLTAGRPALTEHHAKELLRRWGFRTPEGRLAGDPAEAGAAAAALGGPVALKLQAASLVHKSEAGGVALGLVGPEAVSRRAEKMLAALPGLLIEGFLVERMAAPGVEMMLGALNDADFGPLVMVGTGGVHAELLADRAFAPAPVTAAIAQDLIARLRGASLLAARAGRPAADVEALAQALVRLSQLAVAAAAQIGEIDLNPVVVHPAGQGVTVVDAAVLAPPAPLETPADQTGC